MSLYELCSTLIHELGRSPDTFLYLVGKVLPVLVPNLHAHPAVSSRQSSQLSKYATEWQRMLHIGESITGPPLLRCKGYELCATPLRPDDPNTGYTTPFTGRLPDSMVPICSPDDYGVMTEPRNHRGHVSNVILRKPCSNKLRSHHSWPDIYCMSRNLP